MEMNTTTAAVHLDEIAQVALTAIDLDEARTFYRDVLGMKFLFDAGSMTFFQCGSVRLLIGTAEQGTASASPTILYFRVADIQAAADVLRDKGVTLSQEPHLVARMKSHDLWLAFFKDPSGNALALMCEQPRSAS
jgi:methylmalonyl-CoA/ethylmalonyl-CoA epimerase